MIRLQVTDLAASRGGEPVFSAVSFDLAQGEGLTVTGPNGAGKSTLVRVLAGLLPAVSGTVSLTGTEGVACHFIDVNNAMKPVLTVRENLNFWQRFTGDAWLGPADALARLGMAHVVDNRFSELSTGQKRRVSLARLFLNRRPVWLLDEPTTGLDTASEALFAELLSAHLSQGGLFVAATHLPLGDAAKKTLRFEEAG